MPKTHHNLDASACLRRRIRRRIEQVALIAMLAPAPALAARSVVAVGDPAPGGGTFSSVGADSPFLLGANDRGDVLFWSGVSGGTIPWGVFLFADGAITKIVGEGDASPLGGSFINILDYTGTYRLNNRRDVAFVAQVADGRSGGGVFLYSGGVISSIVATGDQAPLPALIDPITDPDIFTGVFGYITDLNDQGDVIFVTMQGKPAGMSFVSIGGAYLAPLGSAVARIVTSGVTTEVGRLNISPGLGPFANNNRQFLLWGTTDQPTQGVFLCQAGSCQKVVAVGDPIPGGTWPLASGPCCIVGLNDSQQVALQGLSLRGEVLIWSGGVFQRDIVSGYPVSEPVAGTLDSITGSNGDLRPLSNMGELAFSGQTVEGGPAAPGVFVLSAATLRKRVAAQDPAPGHGLFTAFGRSTVNNTGCIAFEANTSGDLGYYYSIWQDCPPQKVPLGGSLRSTSNPGYFKVYMPTKWGGKLNIYTVGGTRSAVNYPDGTLFMSSDEMEKETGENKQGWYTFQVSGSADYQVFALFTQTGQSSRRPWNFYYWSAKASFIQEPDMGGNGLADSTARGDDVQVIPVGAPAAPGADIIRSGPDGTIESAADGDDQLVTMINLFSVTGDYQPLIKYDARHGTTARDWEAANDQSDEAWCGHCLGCTIASIKLNQPTPIGGSAYNQDEVEGLWCELGENRFQMLSDAVGPIPPGPPVPGPDPTDFAAPDYHRLLEQYVKSAHEALYSQMRAASGPDRSVEVWNHAVYKFEADFEEAPGGNEKIIKIRNFVSANDDIPPPSTDESSRQVIYTYIISYTVDGSPDSAAAATKDWISVGGSAAYAPERLGKVGTPSWNADNPMVTEANVRADDGANP
jgi:hypothetical protein